MGKIKIGDKMENEKLMPAEVLCSITANVLKKCDEVGTPRQVVDCFNIIGGLADSNPYTPLDAKLRYALLLGISSGQVQQNLPSVIAANPGKRDLVDKTIKHIQAFKQNGGKKISTTGGPYVFTAPNQRIN